MLTKESIVQRLLDEKLITAKEAVVLLKTENTKWLPSPNPQPWIGPGTTLPYQPYTSPSTPYNPMFPQCDWTVRPNQMPLYGGTTYSRIFGNTANENFCDK